MISSSALDYPWTQDVKVKKAELTYDHTEEGEECNDNLLGPDVVDVDQGNHGVVQHHRHPVIEERLAEDHEVKTDIDVNILEDGQHCHRINW